MSREDKEMLAFIGGFFGGIVVFIVGAIFFVGMYATDGWLR